MKACDYDTLSFEQKSAETGSLMGYGSNGKAQSVQLCVHFPGNTHTASSPLAFVNVSRDDSRVRMVEASCDTMSGDQIGLSTASLNAGHSTRDARSSTHTISGPGVLEVVRRSVSV